MDNIAFVIFLSTCCFTLFAINAAGLATVFRRSSRVPPWLQTAVVPGAKSMGRATRGGFLASHLTFIAMFQGLLIAGLLQESTDTWAKIVILLELALAASVGVYFFSNAKSRV